jgi:hypothetical protein
LPCCPIVFIRFGYVKLPFVLIINTYQGFIVCPTELRPQCGRNWKTAIKLAVTAPTVGIEKPLPICG